MNIHEHQAKEILKKSGATVPDGFYKYLTFSDNRKMCFYFDNSATDKDWTEHEINCN